MIRQILPFLFSFFFTSILLAQDFQLERSFSKHKEAVSYLAFREEDNLLVSGDESGEIIFWNSQTGKMLHRSKAHSGLITHLEFSPDALHMASASYDGTIKLWNLADFKVENTFRNGSSAKQASASSEPCFVLFTPDGKQLIYGGYNLEIIRADIRKGDTRKVYTDPKHSINCAQISPDKKHLAVGLGSTIRFFRLQDFTEVFKISMPDRYENYVCELEFHPINKTLSAWLYDGRLQSWDIRKREIVQSLDATRAKGTSNIAFSGDGQFIVTGNQGTETKLWDFETGEVVQLLRAHKGAVVTFDYSKDGAYIVTGGKDSAIHLWKKRKGPIPVSDQLPKKVKGREVEAQEVLRVQSPEVEILFWDNQKIDGDIISVSLNGEWILEQYRLDAVPKELPVRFEGRRNYLIIHAENEGVVKPNTIALTIRDGVSEQTVTLRSTLKTSAALQLIYEPNIKRQFD